MRVMDCLPLPLTHVAFRLGSAAWSATCSGGSGGSLYIMTLLDRRRRAPCCLLEFILSLCSAAPALVPGAKERVRGRRMEDRLAAEKDEEEVKWCWRMEAVSTDGYDWSGE